ncbi:MAG: DUF4956 domain-containing protein [Planctomycetota bacterium]
MVEQIPEQIPGRWTQLQDAFTLPGESSFFALLAMLFLGGVLAIYLRFLYRWTAPKAAGGTIARVFPLLTLVTIAVIAVVKSSLALSLGLVGALSIVRFRAAIKDPEELVYLFLCIGVGLALGATQVWIAIALVVGASVFILVFDRMRPGNRSGDAFVSIVGDAARFVGSGDTTALSVARAVFPRLTVERCEIEDREGQLRMRVHGVDPDGAPDLLSRLRERLPECRISWVNSELLP